MANFAIEDDFQIYQIFKIEELYLTNGWYLHLQVANLVETICNWKTENVRVLIHVNNVQVKNYLGGIIKKSL